MQLCGDAHLSNFGVFQAPDRRLVFDINDFDETLPGPFEWDVKRLAASFAVAGASRGFDPAPEARSCRTWRGPLLPRGDERVRHDARRSTSGTRASTSTRSTAQWEQDANKAEQEALEQNLDKARNKDSLQAVRQAHPRRRRRAPDRRADPPLLVPIDKLSAHEDHVELRPTRSTRAPRLPAHPAGRPPALLERYRLRRRGPQGRRGRQRRHPRLDRAAARPRRRRPALPADEGGRAVGAGALPGQSEFGNHGQRVVEGQRLTQAASDILLGWLRGRRHRRQEARLLHAPALGRQGIGGRRDHVPATDEGVRPDLRPDPGPRPRPLRRRRRDRRLPRHGGQVRPRPWPSSPSATPTRTTVTSRRSATPRTRDASRCSRACRRARRAAPQTAARSGLVGVGDLGVQVPLGRAGAGPTATRAAQDEGEHDRRARRRRWARRRTPSSRVHSAPTRSGPNVRAGFIDVPEIGLPHSPASAM